MRPLAQWRVSPGCNFGPDRDRRFDIGGAEQSRIPHVRLRLLLQTCPRKPAWTYRIGLDVVPWEFEERGDQEKNLQDTRNSSRQCLRLHYVDVFYDRTPRHSHLGGVTESPVWLQSGLVFGRHSTTRSADATHHHELSTGLRMSQYGR